MSLSQVRAGSRRSAASLAAVLLAGCAPALSDAPQSVAASAPVTAFDGIYDGTRTPDPGCGFAGPVGYEVAGGSIWQRTTTASRRLDGAIDQDGRFRMANPAGDHVVTGTIRANRLAATDTFPLLRYRHEHSVVQADLPCTAQIVATRTGPGHGSPPAD